MQSEQGLPQEWQKQLLQSVIDLLATNEDIIALGVRGSLLELEQLDIWSDVDVALVVRDSALAHFFPALGWLTSLGEIYAYEQRAHGDRWITRICFEDFRRLDVAITSELKLIAAERHSQTVFPGPVTLFFSRSHSTTRALSREDLQKTAPGLPAESFEQMSSGFWFKAVVAVTKVVRNDLLIALHLTLELLQECSVLGMMLRDRATGTSYHRSGGIGNELVSVVPVIEQPYTARNILDAIEKSGVAFDQLTSEWTDNSGTKHHLLTGYIDRARQSI